MDKNIITTFVCIIIFYIVYLKISSQHIKKEKIEIETEPEIEIENFGNNIENNNFDVYKFYNKLTNPIVHTKITKDNYDYDYESDFKYKNIPIIAEDIKENFGYNPMYPKNNLNFESQGGGSREQEKDSTLESPNLPRSNLRFQEESPNFTNKKFLVPNDMDSNAIYSVPFPENTSIELAQFTAENVTDLFNSNNMEDLYNNINADVYRGYKTMKYML
jgi:hypothetical protein